MNPIIKPPRLSSDDGERLKKDAHDSLTARREAHVRRAQRALLLIIIERGEATADDVRDVIDLPAHVGPQCLGAVPGPLARLGIIEAAGYVNSRRPEAHARPNRVWRLKDLAKADAWLAAHPEPVPVMTTANDAPARTQLDLFADPAPNRTNNEGGATC